MSIFRWFGSGKLHASKPTDGFVNGSRQAPSFISKIGHDYNDEAEEIGENSELLRLQYENIITEFEKQKTIIKEFERTFNVVNDMTNKISRSTGEMHKSELKRARLDKSSGPISDQLTKHHSLENNTGLETGVAESVELENQCSNDIKILENHIKMQDEKNLKKINTLMSLIVHLTDENNQNIEKVDKLTSEIRDANIGISNLETFQNKLFGKLEYIEGLYENDKADLERLEKSLADSELVQSNLQEFEFQARSKLSFVKSENEKHVKIIEELRETIAAISATEKNKALSYEKKIENLNDRVKVTEQLLDQTSVTKKDLDDKNQALNDLSSELEIAKQNVARLIAENTTLAEEINTYRTRRQHELSDNGKLLNDRNSITISNEQTTGEQASLKDALNSERVEHESELRKLLYRIAKLEDKLDKAESDRRKLLAALDVARKDRLQLRTTIQSLEGRANEARPVVTSELVNASETSSTQLDISANTGI